MKNDSIINLSVAIDKLNSRISEINIKIVNGDNSEKNKKELEKYLNLKDEMLNGNMLLIDKVINGAI